MRILGFVFVILLAAAFMWPYVVVYRLGTALSNQDQATLQSLVDLEAIRARYKADFSAQALGLQSPRHPPGDPMEVLANMLNTGAQGLSDLAVNNLITLDWVRETLKPRTAANAAQDPYPSLLLNLSFGFYESPTRFLVRIGELGASPVHFYLTLQDWQWRLTAVYP